MLEKLDFDVVRIPFKSTEADEIRERDLHKANQLWKEGKYRGALLCYDSVITDASKQMTGTWNRMIELRVACLNKLQLLQSLFRLNKLWSVHDCKELFDLYDSYIKTLDETIGQTHRTEIEMMLFTKSILLINKGKLTQQLTDVSTAMPIYVDTLYIFNELITLSPTEDRYYYNKGIHLSRMRKNQEALESLSLAKELSTSEWLLENIDYAIKTIHKGSYFF